MIHIRDLRLRTIIGVHEYERKQRQDVVLNLAIETDLTRAAESDDLADALDYGELTRMLTGFVEESRFRLIERLAAAVCDRILDACDTVTEVTVTVDKPAALPLARSVAVTLHRGRP